MCAFLLLIFLLCCTISNYPLLYLLLITYFLHKMHNTKTNYNTKERDHQYQAHLHCNPQSPFLHISYIWSCILLTLTFRNSKQVTLLQIKIITNHPTEQYVNKPKTHQNIIQKTFVPILFCIISPYPIVDILTMQRKHCIHDKMSFGSCKIMTTKPINNHSQWQIMYNKNNCLANNRLPIKLRPRHSWVLHSLLLLQTQNWSNLRHHHRLL